MLKETSGAFDGSRIYDIHITSQTCNPLRHAAFSRRWSITITLIKSRQEHITILLPGTSELKYLFLNHSVLYCSKAVVYVVIYWLERISKYNDLKDWTHEYWIILTSLLSWLGQVESDSLLFRNVQSIPSDSGAEIFIWTCKMNWTNGCVPMQHPVRCVWHHQDDYQISASCRSAHKRLWKGTHNWPIHM